VELHPTLIKLHGKSYNYTVLYKNIARIFVLPSQDNRHVFIVVRKPIVPVLYPIVI
jgi:structure-specific recognition protein 1